MAWNGSGDLGRATSTKSPRVGRKGTSAKRPYLRGIVAGLVIVVLVGFAVWLIVGRESMRPVGESGTKKHATIGEATPAPARSSLVVTQPTQVVENVVTHPATNQWGNPWHWGPNKKLHPKHISRLNRSELPLYEQVFKNSADREIGGLLVIEPGDDIIGSDEPSPWFLKSLAQAFENPVKIEPDDTDEVKELKKAVLETEAELKKRMAAGEDVIKIIADTRRELRELGAYREELKDQIKEYSRNGDITTDDMKDMVEAANRMLNERGLKKITLPEFYFQRIEYRKQLRKAKENN